jgi:hypothetical protein
MDYVAALQAVTCHKSCNSKETRVPKGSHLTNDSSKQLIQTDIHTVILQFTVKISGAVGLFFK